MSKGYYGWILDGDLHRLIWVERKSGRQTAQISLARAFRDKKKAYAEVERRNCNGPIVPPTAAEILPAEEQAKAMERVRYHAQRLGVSPPSWAVAAS